MPAEELRRAKDHLKGSFMLGLESTSSRMGNLARQEMYFKRFFTLDEMIRSIEESPPNRCSESRRSSSTPRTSRSPCWATWATSRSSARIWPAEEIKALGRSTLVVLADRPTGVAADRKFVQRPCVELLFLAHHISLRPRRQFPKTPRLRQRLRESPGPQSRAQLEAYCGRVEQLTGVQMAIVTIDTLDGNPIDDVANTLYRKWGIGKKGKDEGILLLARHQGSQRSHRSGLWLGTDPARRFRRRSSAPGPSASAPGRLRTGYFFRRQRNGIPHRPG